MFRISHQWYQEQEELLSLVEAHQRIFQERLKKSFSKHLGYLWKTGLWAVGVGKNYLYEVVTPTSDHNC
jgi:hypothetical protein